MIGERRRRGTEEEARHGVARSGTEDEARHRGGGAVEDRDGRGRGGLFLIKNNNIHYLHTEWININ